MKKIKMVIGVIAALCGLFIAFGSFRMTGFAVAELNGFGNSGGIIGIVIILAGAVILGKNIYREGHDGKPRTERDNKEAEYVARLNYRFVYHRQPTKQQLIEHKRGLHESGELHRLIEEYRERKK